MAELKIKHYVLLSSQNIKLIKEELFFYSYSDNLIIWVYYYLFKYSLKAAGNRNKLNTIKEKRKRPHVAVCNSIF